MTALITRTDAHDRRGALVTQMLAVCEEAQRLLSTRCETLEEIDAPCKVFGDIHGQFTDLLQFFIQYGAPSHRHGDVNCVNYCFCGDFVDRGAHSVETLMLLLCLKLRYAESVHLLRGNHEDDLVNKQYGFKDEVMARVAPRHSAAQLYSAIQSVFNWLPLAAVIERKILCVHGGIGQTCHTLGQIRAIRRPVLDTIGRDESSRYAPPPPPLQPSPADSLYPHIQSPTHP